MARTLVLLVSFALIGLFALLNWPAFTTPTALNLLFTTVEAPLGVIMLGLVALLCLAFVGWALSMQATVLLESRRQNKELQAQRELADKAEASRFTELRSFISAELVRLSQMSEETRVRVVNRLDLLEHKQRQSIEQGVNSLAASLGEIEDRIERTGGFSHGSAATTVVTTPTRSVIAPAEPVVQTVQTVQPVQPVQSVRTEPAPIAGQPSTPQHL